MFLLATFWRLENLRRGAISTLPDSGEWRVWRGRIGVEMPA
jgi:hypothetical protein